MFCKQQHKSGMLFGFADRQDFKMTYSTFQMCKQIPSNKQGTFFVKIDARVSQIFWMHNNTSVVCTLLWGITGTVQIGIGLQYLLFGTYGLCVLSVCSFSPYLTQSLTEHDPR